MGKRKKSKKEDESKLKRRLRAPSNLTTPPSPTEEIESKHHEDGEPAPVISRSHPSSALAVVGIGASAGGLENFKQFFSEMPSDSGIAFVLIQHLDPTHESMIAELLSRHTKMPVIQLTDAMKVERDHVYVIPPNKYVTISGEKLYLSDPVERRGLRMPADYFLRSLAYDQHERSIGIILSGAGTDGTLGVREIKAAGGMVMAQEPGTILHDSMPRSAISTGIVDYTLPVKRMPEILVRYVHHWYVNGGVPPPRVAEKGPNHLNAILNLMRARIKYDFHCYKKGTLTRRIQRRMGLHHIEKMEDYAELLRKHKQEVNLLYKDLLIGVTNFFREPESWEALQKEALAPIVQRQASDAPIRAWVAGCATGEEAYSLAMALVEQLHAAEKTCPIQIFASDIDQDALAFARAGIYPENIAADVPAERLRQFFIKGEHTYRINKEIRDCVVFAEQNVISDPPFSKLDLISCRNLMIYLESSVQQKMLSMFHFAIREGGFLFLGGSETISQNLDLFDAVSRKHRIYRRIGPARFDRLELPIKLIEPSQLRRGRAMTQDEPKVRRMNALVHQLMLQRFAPACAVINRKMEVLHLNGPINDYLQLPPGELAADLLAMAREGLRAKLRAAIHQAIRNDQTVTLQDVQIKRGKQYQSIGVTVEPLRQPKETQGLLLITFDDNSNSGPHAHDGERKKQRQPPTETAKEPEGEFESIIKHLEDELHTSREDLQSTIEELETSNEEFKAANEEVTSINEELQSTNEELETSKEELQSLNEELQTVNSQLEQKLTELELTNNDLSNLLASTDIATLFLDRQFRLKRYTPAATRIFRMIGSDLGRPLRDLNRDVADDDLFTDAVQVLERLNPIEKEVRDAEDHTYVRRISPYRTEDNRINGVVITFTDISARKDHEVALQQLNQELERRVQERTAQADMLVEDAPDAMFIINRSGQIIQVNRRAESAFGRNRADIVGQPVEMFLHESMRQRHIEFRQAFFAEPNPRPMGIGVELFGCRADGTQFPIEVQLSPLVIRNEQVAVAAIRDVTERKQAAEARDRLASIFSDSPASIMVLTAEGIIESWNRGAEKLFGYSARESVGEHVQMLFPPDRTRDFSRVIETVQRGGVIQDYESIGLHKDGTRIDVSLTTSPARDVNGRVIGYCHVAYDIRERKRLEHQLATALDVERQRLGRELHDSLGQQLTGIGMLIALLKGQTKGDVQQAEVVTRLESSLHQSKQQLRALAKGLFPVDVDARGLKVALSELATELADLYQVPCRFECPDDVLLESNFTATQLYLFAREAIHNAAKHARAREIVVRLEFNNGFTVSVHDDGTGVRADLDETATMGMRIMRYRCSLIGGSMRIDSTAGGGTVIACSLQFD